MTRSDSEVVHITFLACPGGIGSTYTETATLTAANGDSLELSGSGTACAGGGMVTGDGTLAITGGARHFAEATGSLSEQFVRDLAAGVEREKLSGTVSTPGAARFS